MLLEFIVTLLLGIIAGTLTGLAPGIHTNLIAVILLELSTFFLSITTPIILVIFITSMAITHTFIDFIPSIFLGAPDEDSFLSILPGHRLLLKGRGYYAIIFTLYGSLTALPIIIIFIPIFLYILPAIYPFIQKTMPIILISVSLFLINSEKNNKLWTLFIFLLSGFLGIASLNLDVREPLLPLLTGLFGASSLIVSIGQKTKIPKQNITKLRNIRLSKSSILRTSLASVLSAPFTAFLPGLGASQAALIGRSFLNIKDQREFLFLLGSINTIVMGLSFVTLYSINKTRTGAAATISQLINSISLTDLTLIIITIIISGLLSFLLTIIISKTIAKNIHKIKYDRLSTIILFILLLVILIFADPNFQGKVLALLIFATATSLGIFTISKGIRRMHLMGCLLLPTIIFYLS